MIEQGTETSPVVYTSDVTAQLDDVAGSDRKICKVARVSTLGEKADEDVATIKRNDGLIRYLMQNKHGCYDDDTEVLTADGWRKWPDITGAELFCTLNVATDAIEYQRAQRVIHKRVDGPMTHVRTNQVDMLVTPDHNMLCAERINGGWTDYQLVPAANMHERAHRVRMGGGKFSGHIHAPEDAALLGFIAADGHVGSSITFRLRKQRKIEWLTSRATVYRNGDSFTLRNPSAQLRQWAEQTYTDAGDRCLPHDLLTQGNAETLAALLDGYLMGDGNVSPTGKITACTVSSRLIDDLQILALKTGGAATETAPDRTRNGAYGTRPVRKLTFYRARNITPRIGWTQADRQAQVSTIDYHGTVHCVTVPNGTLYVRRNGKPMWCGNSPFEHGLLTFFVTAPIFVFWDHVRHRIGVSYNVESSRYRELQPTFYVPRWPRTQEGKPGQYIYKRGDLVQYDIMRRTTTDANAAAWQAYQERLAAGICREQAMQVLPMNTVIHAYVTFNPRSLMKFLELRLGPAREEMQVLAMSYANVFAARWPMTFGAFQDFGRVCP